MITFRSYTLRSEVIITLHFSLLTLNFARRKRFLEAREIDGYPVTSVTPVTPRVFIFKFLFYSASEG